MGGWSVTNNNVDLFGTGQYNTPSGGRSVDMNGTGPGTISQNIATTVGQTYLVRFLMAGGGAWEIPVRWK